MAWLHDRRVIAFTVAAPHDQDREWVAESSAPSRLAVLTPARVLANQTTGFVRVEAKAAGTADLRIGEATLWVNIVESPTGHLPEQRRPRITTPVDGAAVWDGFSAAVEVFDEFNTLSEAGEEVALVLPDGRALSPVSASSAKEGPHRRFAFRLSADDLSPGVARLVAEVRGVPGIPEASRPVDVAVFGTEAVDIVIDEEAEARAGAPRPRRAGGRRDLQVQERDGASGGQVVSQNSGGRSVAVPVPVGEGGGWYAVRVEGGGSSVSALLPTVGVIVDAEDRPRTRGTLAQAEHHAAFIGRPFWLDAPNDDERVDEVDPRAEPDAEPLFAWPEGQRVLTFRFENDFNAGKIDRNLWLDRVQVVWLPQGSLPSETPKLSGELDADAVRGPFVGLDPTLDGTVVGGPIRIDGFVAADRDGGVPEVALVVNGGIVSTTRDARPTFWLTPGQLGVGVNTVQLQATLASNGQTYLSAAQTLRREADAPAVSSPRRVLHFGVHDPAWQSPVKSKLEPHNRNGKRRVAAFYSNGHVDLRLPDDVTGPFLVELEGFGDAFEGAPRATVSLLGAGEKLIPIGEADFGRWPDVRRIGVASPNQEAEFLRIAFANDKYKPESGKDRNLFITGVTLWEQPDGLEESASLAIAYPANGETVQVADALVAEVRSTSRITWAEAIIDGEPTGLRFSVHSGSSRVLVPLALRESAEAGADGLNLAVRVGDGDEVLGRSESVSVTLANAGADESNSAYRQAVAFLNRVALGPTPHDLADILVEGRAAWLDRHLTAGWSERAGLRDAWLLASVGRQNVEPRNHLTRRAAHHLLLTPNAVRARLAMFVDNHLTTWWLKATPTRRIDDHANWLELGAAPFHELLFTSATSPAMMRYLDQERSFANRLNENYAREIMELHTVGVHGGYTQADVTALAKLLTGWRSDQTARNDAFGRLNQPTFRYLPRRNLPDAQTVFGYAFSEAKPLRERYDRARSAIELLASHPATARYLGTKLVGHYAGLPADPELTAAAKDAFHTSGGDLRQVVRAIVLHPDYLDRAQARRLAHPWSFAARLQRLAGNDNPHRLVNYTDSAGFGLFDRDTPDGYPEEDDAYADTNATLQRWRFAGEVSGDLVRRLPDRLAYPRGFADEQAEAAWQQSLIDHLAIFITGDVLGDNSNDAALEILQSTEQTGWSRNRLMAQFIAQLPESALR